MKTYEGKSQYRSQGGGGGFRPVSAPDIASAMRRENQATESRDRRTQSADATTALLSRTQSSSLEIKDHR